MTFQRCHSRNASLHEAQQSLAINNPAENKILRNRGARLLVDLFHDLTHLTAATLLIECGAREAEASVRFIREGSDRRAIAFEANPWTYEQMTSRSIGPRLVALPEGLGVQPGKLALQVPAKQDEMAPTPGNGSFLPRTKATTTLSVLVPVTTLDLVAERFSVAEPVALWVDVEGFSREVLMGGSRLLNDFVEIALVEVEEHRYWDGGALEDEITAIMESAGLVPAARDLQYVGQFNTLYLRRRHVGASQDKINRYSRRAFRAVSKSERAVIALRRLSGRSPLKVFVERAKAVLRSALGPGNTRTLKRMLNRQ